MGSGRAEFLQKEIIEAIKRAKSNDTLSDGGVQEIFGDLLKDFSIKTILSLPETLPEFKKMWEESKPNES